MGGGDRPRFCHQILGTASSRESGTHLHALIYTVAVRPLPTSAAAEPLRQDNGAKGSARPQVRHELKGLGWLFLTPHILAENKSLTHPADPYQGGRQRLLGILSSQKQH